MHSMLRRLSWLTKPGTWLGKLRKCTDFFIIQTSFPSCIRSKVLHNPLSSLSLKSNQHNEYLEAWSLEKFLYIKKDKRQRSAELGEYSFFFNFVFNLSFSLPQSEDSSASSEFWCNSINLNMVKGWKMLDPDEWTKERWRRDPEVINKRWLSRLCCFLSCTVLSFVFLEKKRSLQSSVKVQPCFLLLLYASLLLFLSPSRHLSLYTYSFILSFSTIASCFWAMCACWMHLYACKMWCDVSEIRTEHHGSQSDF